MNRLRLLLPLLLTACMDSDLNKKSLPIPTEPTDVYLIMGQSNALGGADEADLPPELAFYADPYSMAYAEEYNCPKDGTVGACTFSGTWEETVEPRSTGAFGIELAAARRMDERSSNVVALIKHATNGSHLYNHWDATNGGYTLWNYATNYVDDRLAELPSGSRVTGLFWVQGNGDASNINTSGDYAENLAFMALQLRDHYGCVPVVLDRLHPLFVASYAQTVRDEQDQAAALVDDVVVVPTDDLVLRDGIQHYDAASFVTLGLRMADAMPLCP